VLRDGSGCTIKELLGRAPLRYASPAGFRDSLFWTIGILIPVAGVVLIAGGGEFGGAGSLIHW
jgi:hypothetical protein